MPITKQKKVDIVRELKAEVTPAESIVFVNFHGLSVAETTSLRKSLRDKGIGLKVAKKTLLRLAFGGELPALDGEVAVAYQANATDVIATPREVYQFAKSHPDHLKILGGVFEGKYVGEALMLELATIPSREVLLSKLLNLFNSPLTRFALVLDAISKK